MLYIYMYMCVCVCVCMYYMYIACNFWLYRVNVYVYLVKMYTDSKNILIREMFTDEWMYLMKEMHTDARDAYWWVNVPDARDAHWCKRCILISECIVMSGMCTDERYTCYRREYNMQKYIRIHAYTIFTHMDICIYVCVYKYKDTCAHINYSEMYLCRLTHTQTHTHKH